MLWVTIVLAKMVSYTHVNNTLRTQHFRNPKSDSPYPQNLTLKNFFYFVGAPTLCYSTQYPRSVRIRKAWLARRIAEAVCHCSYSITDLKIALL